jgi:hypothetical protein
MKVNCFIAMAPRQRFFYAASRCKISGETPAPRKTGKRGKWDAIDSGAGSVERISIRRRSHGREKENAFVVRGNRRESFRAIVKLGMDFFHRGDSA